jgi:hypothetical protein
VVENDDQTKILVGNGVRGVGLSTLNGHKGIICKTISKTTFGMELNFPFDFCLPFGFV